MKHIFLIGLTYLFWSSSVHAQEEEQPQYKEQGRLTGTVKAQSKTNIDFNETLIEGQMKVPQGFFIQGRQGQSMANMVKLRSNFRSKLKQSKHAVKALVK